MENSNKKATPVELKGKSNVAKKSEIGKFVKNVFAGSIMDAVKYTYNGVIIPYLKDGICKGGINFIQSLIYGDTPPSQKNNNYSNISWSRNGSSIRTIKPNDTPVINNSRSNIYNVNDITFEERGDAEEILLKLKEILSVYSVVTVGDFYDIVNNPSLKSNFTDYDYGWRDISTARVVRNLRGDYSIELPKVGPIK